MRLHENRSNERPAAASNIKRAMQCTVQRVNKHFYRMSQSHVGRRITTTGLFSAAQTLACNMTMTMSLRSLKYCSMAARVSRGASICDRYMSFVLAVVIEPPVVPGTTAPPPMRGNRAPCCDGGLGGDWAKPGNPYWCGMPMLCSFVDFRFSCVNLKEISMEFRAIAVSSYASIIQLERLHRIAMFIAQSMLLNVLSRMFQIWAIGDFMEIPGGNQKKFTLKTPSSIT